MASHKRRVNTNTDHIKCGHSFFNVVVEGGGHIKCGHSFFNVVVEGGGHIKCGHVSLMWSSKAAVTVWFSLMWF